ncbi:hypothetical protein GCM10010517_35540 [Streptosporangium fragile]|uniref:Uncharacterized protein n=1 Tax=Streptosporangium fragile TaxID=46186 RepID=A0ABN3VYP5_9ACTN
MGNTNQESALRALGAALDLHAPMVRHSLKAFPEGEPFLRLRVPGAGGATVFVHARQWICLSEPEPGGVAGQLTAGQVDDDPALVVGRLMSVMAPVRGRRGVLPRVLKAAAVGGLAAAGVGLLCAVIMAVLVVGNGHLDDTTTAVVYTLAVLLGLGSGLWVALRVWRLG